MKGKQIFPTLLIATILLTTTAASVTGTPNQTQNTQIESILNTRSQILLIPDSTTDTVGTYDPFDGTYLGDIIDGTGYFSTPINAIQGPDGNIYVSDQLADSVFVFSPIGTYLYTYADSSDGLNNIRGIDFRGNNLFITSGDDYVAEFDGPHSRLPDFINDGTDPFDILFLPDGRSLLADIQGTTDNIRLYDANGVLIQQLFQVNFPEQVQFDTLSPGDYLTAAFSEDVIQDFDISGTIYESTPLNGGRGVYRLGNGNLLATSGSGVFELEPGTGTVVEQENTGSGRFIEPMTTQNYPPNIPSNPDPANESTDIALDTDLTWVGGDPNGDPVTYDVYFGTSPSPPKVAANQSGELYDPGTLTFTTTYYWKIVAWEPLGNHTSGPEWQFTTRGNSPPNTPSSPSPTDLATNVAIDTDLSWTGGDPDGDPVTYDIYFGITPSPPLVSNNQTGTSYDPGTLQFSTTYYWKIVAWDSFGETTSGPQWQFTTRSNSPPNTPSAPTPSNGATDVSITTDLSWTGDDPDGDSVTYDVYFGTSTSPPQVSANQSSTTYDPGTLDFSTTYTWYIVAWDQFGEKTTGPTWDFTTRGNSPPNTPSNPNPADTATDISIDTDLSWTGGDPDGDTVTYDLYFGTATDPPLEASGLTTTAYTLDTLEYDTTYYWKIIAADQFGTTTEGPIWSFTTARLNATPTIPEITGKAKGKANTPYDYTFVSTDDDGDDLYYYIEWGDGAIEEWIGPYSQGDPIVVSHTWENKDTYTIRAKARDTFGVESDWGTLQIEMPHSYSFINTFLTRIFSRFPIIYQILQQLIQ